MSALVMAIDGLLCFELQCGCTDFFAVKTLRFTCLSITLLCDQKHHNDTELKQSESGIWLEKSFVSGSLVKLHICLLYTSPSPRDRG